jgi:hypothetical protein
MLRFIRVYLTRRYGWLGFLIFAPIALIWGIIRLFYGDAIDGQLDRFHRYIGTVAPEEVASGSASRLPAGCTFQSLPPDFTFAAVGVYQSASAIPLLDDPRLPRRAPVEVDVTARDRPVVLVLSAHTPVQWNVRIYPGVDLRGVVLTGYGSSALATDAPELPVTVIDATQNAPCGAGHVSAYEEKDIPELQAFATRVAGAALSSFRGSYEACQVVVGSPDGVDPVACTEKLATPAGEDPDPAIQALVTRGVLHKMTRQERGAAHVLRGTEFDPDLFYQINAPLTFPVTMIASLRRGFFIPSGVVIPREAIPDGEVFSAAPIDGCKHWVHQKCRMAVTPLMAPGVYPNE